MEIISGTSALFAQVREPYRLAVGNSANNRFLPSCMGSSYGASLRSKRATIIELRTIIDFGQQLNHYFGERAKVFPGDSLEGLLLGRGDRAIPDDFSDGQRIQTILSIYDTRENCFEVPVNLCVSHPRRYRANSRSNAGHRKLVMTV